MRVKIDIALCQGHGLCQEEAPEVFRVIEVKGAYDRVELVTEEPEASLREKVEAAVRYCPNRVISLVESDPAATRDA
jgi:ferredoxin